MRLDPKTFSVAGRDIRWGTTLLELKELLTNEVPIKSNVNHVYPTIHIECVEAYGFAASEFEADAPEFSLPVQRVRYKLVPPSKGYARPEPNFWMLPIMEALGDPAENHKYRHVNPNMPSSSVVHSATWNIEKIKLSLSVWGGVRQSSQGRLSAAGLYIYWDDVIQVAKPVIHKNLLMEAKLELFAKEANDVDVFDLTDKQQPYFHRASAKYPFKPPADENVRRAQRALHRSNLMDTPSTIRDCLDDNEVAVWQIEDGVRFVVSTKWDSVVIDPNQHNRVAWENVLPAKGGGGMHFTISHLTLHDKTRSKKLTAVVEKIQEYLPQPIKCHESYDA